MRPENEQVQHTASDVFVEREWLDEHLTNRSRNRMAPAICWGLFSLKVIVLHGRSVRTMSTVPTMWEYEKCSDRVLGENPAEFSTRLADLPSIVSGSLFLRSGEQRLEMWWDGSNSVIIHCPSDEGDLECPITESSLDRAEIIPKKALLKWDCPCCGVAMGTFSPSVHIQRNAAFDIFLHVFQSYARPEECVDGPVVWLSVDVD